MKEKEIKTKGKYSPPKRANGNLAQPRSLAKRSILGAGRQARQTAEKEEPSRENSSQYAENRIERSAENIAQEAVYRGKRLARKAVRRAWQKERSAGADRIPQQANNPATGNAVRQNYRVRTIRGWQATRARRTTEAVRETERIRQTARQTTQTAKTAQHTAKASGKAIKTGSKGIKAASKGIKTSAQTAKATAKATVKTAQATARASARLAQATKAAVKAAVTAAKALAKAAAAAAKAIAAAIKGLIAVIAAGGWVVLIIILVAAVIALILGSAFGLFFTDDLNEGRLKQAIVGTNTKFTAGLQARIDQLSSGGYDAVVVSYDGDYDGDGAIVNNWQDVLAVFATKNMYDGEELLDFDDAKAAAMALVFNHMNKVDFDTRVETDSTTAIVDGEEVEVTTSTLYINVTINSMTYIEGAELYRFDAEKLRLLEELMSEDYNEL